MNYSDTLATAKANLLRELGRKRKWQSYVVAVGLSLCFFLVVGNVFAESSKEPAKKKPIAAEKASEKKIKGFRLSDQESAKASNWETSTGVAPAPADQSEVQSPEVEEPQVGPPVEAAGPAEETAEAAPLGDVESATQLTNSFYSALNEGHLGEAYDKLSPEFQTNLPFEIFSNGYACVESINCQVTNSQQLDDGQVRLDLQIDATEAGYPSTYYATCILSKSQDDWTISGVAQLSLD